MAVQKNGNFTFFDTIGALDNKFRKRTAIFAGISIDGAMTHQMFTEGI